MAVKEEGYCTTSRKTGRKYFLHSKKAVLSGGHSQVIYYFAPEVSENAVAKIPFGYEVVESVTSGLPMLKKK